MSDKISALTNGAPLLHTDEFPAARSGTNRKFNGGDILSYMTRRNFLDNPLMNVAQRGATGVLGTSGAVVSIDRWAAMQATSAAGFCNQQASFVSNRFKRARIGRNSGATNTGGIYFGQALETQDSVLLAGQPFCFSFEALAGANYSAGSGNLNVNVVYGTGTDQLAGPMFVGGWTGWGNIALSASAAALSSAAWNSYVFTGTIPSTATQVGVFLSYAPIGTAGADDSFYITNAYLGPGDYPPPAWVCDGPQLEFARCLRHLPAFTVGQTGERAPAVGLVGATQVAAPWKFPVAARAAPTGLLISAAGDFSCYRYTTNVTAACTAISLTTAGIHSGIVTATVSGGVTVGETALFFPNSASARMLFTGAEL